MGSRSSSSNTTQDNTTNYNLQGLESEELTLGDNNEGSTNISGENNSLEIVTNNTTTDFGAIESAIEFGNGVISSNENVVTTAMTETSELASQIVGFADSVIESNIDSSASTTSAISNLAQSLASGGSSDVVESSTKMVYVVGAVVAVVGIGFVVMMGARK